MRKEFEFSGKKVIVENGGILINGQEAADHLYPYQIREISDAPKNLREHIKKNNIPVEGRVYISSRVGALVPREVADEAVRQTAEIDAAKDPRNVIEGYTELEAAYEDIRRYHRELEESYETSIGPEPIRGNVDELSAKHPKAAAYIAAENYSNAHNYAKSSAGDKAKKRLIAGEDYELVLAEMKAEWSKAAGIAVQNS